MIEYVVECGDLDPKRTAGFRVSKLIFNSSYFVALELYKGVWIEDKSSTTSRQVDAKS